MGKEDYTRKKLQELVEDKSKVVDVSKWTLSAREVEQLVDLMLASPACTSLKVDGTASATRGRRP